MRHLERLTSAAVAGLCALSTLAIGVAGFAQTSVSVSGGPASDVIDVRVTNIIVPQAAHGHAITWTPPTPDRRPPRPVSSPIAIEAIAGDIDIVDGIGSTTMRMTLRNPGTVQQEAQLMVPVPAGATIRSFGFDGGGLEPTAKILPREEARRIYEAIVRRAQDPALLEFVGYNLVKSSVFPVPPGKTQTVSLIYEQVLPRDGERLDFVLPRTASLESTGTKWTISGHIRSQRPIATLYSPSHEIRTTRVNDKELNFEVPVAAAEQPGAFRISTLLEKAGDGIATSVLAYPDPQDPSGGGYFLLLGGVAPAPARAEAEGVAQPQSREVVLVIDRSGSMRGEKIEQVRAAALQVVEGLRDGEAFNIIDYSSTVERFSAKPVIKDAKSLADAKKYINDLKADGGTNIHDALIEAVRPEVIAGEHGPMLPMVLFLTDGLPTVGVTSEAQIREAAARANTHKRRMFTFGVGFDVNAPLLDHLAEANRGASINVLPKENVEIAVSRVFKRLQGPVMNEPTLTAFLGAAGDGPASTRALREVMPPALPDLFEGDQVVVLGRYTGADKMRLRIEGDYRGAKRSFDVDFDPAASSTRNGFVPRLWASRRIAYLIDQIRQNAASSAGQHEPPPELVKEIVELSTRWGILTEYTSFLATEIGAPASAAVPMDAAPAAAARVLDRRAVKGDRGGMDSVNQSMNLKESKAQVCANSTNSYWSADMQLRRVNSVQQVADQTLFCRGNRWMDARILRQTDGETAKPDQTITFGSPEHFALACRLADEGGGEGGSRSALLAMRGEVMLLVDGKRVLITAPEEAAAVEPTAP
ncbi:MAG TPA: VIT domain-containing protein [Phycisphaerales bacterium]|nr:VIT domain-containing protein [Phycisphaerales bacterium]